MASVTEEMSERMCDYWSKDIPYPEVTDPLDKLDEFLSNCAVYSRKDIEEAAAWCGVTVTFISTPDRKRSKCLASARDLAVKRGETLVDFVNE